jgi:hypothetical protein
MSFNEDWRGFNSGNEADKYCGKNKKELRNKKVFLVSVLWRNSQVEKKNMGERRSDEKKTSKFI